MLILCVRPCVRPSRRPTRPFQPAPAFGAFVLRTPSLTVMMMAVMMMMMIMIIKLG